MISTITAARALPRSRVHTQPEAIPFILLATGRSTHHGFHVISGLKAKCAEVAGKIERLVQELGAARRDLTYIDARFTCSDVAFGRN